MKIQFRPITKLILVAVLCAVSAGCSDYVLMRKDKLEEIVDARLKQQDEVLRKELKKDNAAEREQIRNEIMQELSSQFNASCAKEEAVTEGISADPDYDLRKVCWGMPLAAVIKAEGTNYLTCDDKGVTYLSSAAERPCLLRYSFMDDRLAGAIFMFADPRYGAMLPKGQSIAQVHNDYLRLKSLLENKYGKCELQEKKYSDLQDLKTQQERLQQKMTSYIRQKKDLSLKMKREQKDMRERYKDWSRKRRDDLIEAKMADYRKEIRRTEDWICRLDRQKKDMDVRIAKEQKRFNRGEVPMSIRCCWRAPDNHEVLLYYSDARQTPALHLVYNGMMAPELNDMPLDL